MALWSTDEVPTPSGLHAVFRDRLTSPMWFAVRMLVGGTWLKAGLTQLADPRGAWVGANAGEAVRDACAASLAPRGPFTDVAPSVAAVLRGLVVPHAALVGELATYGAILIGTLLILGLFTGIAAFAGGAINVAFMLAGNCGSNPLLFVLATWLALAWRVAGHWGLDRWVLPRVGAPGWPGPRAARRNALVREFRSWPPAPQA